MDCSLNAFRSDQCNPVPKNLYGSHPVKLVGGLTALILGLFPIKELIQVLKEKDSE